MCLLHVSPSTRSSSAGYKQRHASTAHAHNTQNSLYLYAFLYTSLMMTLYMSKHVEGA